jgi:DNA (cytosine-5)-methyltransferase 1
VKIGALFAGYGGLDMAVSQVTGADLAWVCEWDDAPAKILETHYPDVPNYRDVSKVDWSSVEPVDILTGGFPCQDVSLAGARRGLKEGTRSGLWSEFAKAIDVIKPRLVVIENVRGLLSASAGGELEHCSWCLGDESDEPALRALGAVLGDLADLGYDARWQGVRAADAGAPHNRFRVFIVAYPSSGRDGGGMTSPAMAKAKGQTLRLSGQIVDMVEPGRLPQPLLSTPTTQDSSGKCRDHGGDLLHDVQCGCSRAERRLPTPTTCDYKDGQAEHKRDGVVQTDTVARAVFSGDWGQYAPAIERWESVIGRPAPAPTKPDGRDGSHRLSSAFTEWMMGLPEGWVTGCGLTRNEELKACGNGVVPQQAVLALKMLLDNVPRERERENCDVTNTNCK